MPGQTSLSLGVGVVMDDPSIVSILKDRFWSLNRERWFRWALRNIDHRPAEGFFDAFPRFFLTSETAALPDRLNQRHRALIQSNVDIIRGRRVLDIASHDGRWSFAANRAGAEYVLGIEARQRLVEMARDNMLEYGVPQSSVAFMQGDVLTELDRLEPRCIDTVLCFGFLYHTIDHMLLLRKIARLKPMSLVIDTAITTYPGSIIEVHDEAVHHESAGAVGDPGDPTRTVVGVPSRDALELMLLAAGFPTVHYYNWAQVGIERSADLKDYSLGKRVSLTAVAGHEDRNNFRSGHERNDVG
jgi:2-polyprenyl-3-methyl-5-hydroxy-6-metoxy-1,4-benzoquinol methylase